MEKRCGKVWTCLNLSKSKVIWFTLLQRPRWRKFLLIPYTHALFHFTQPHHHANNVLPQRQIKLPARPHLRLTKLPQVSPTWLHPPLPVSSTSGPIASPPHSHWSLLGMATITHTWYIYSCVFWVPSLYCRHGGSAKFYSHFCMVHVWLSEIPCWFDFFESNDS